MLSYVVIKLSTSQKTVVGVTGLRINTRYNGSFHSWLQCNTEHLLTNLWMGCELTQQYNLFADGDAVFMIRRIGTDEKWVWPSLSQQVQPRSLSLGDTPLNIRRTGSSRVTRLHMTVDNWRPPVKHLRITHDTTKVSTQQQLYECLNTVKHYISAAS